MYSFSAVVLAWQVQEVATPPPGSSSSILELVAQTGPVNQIVLGLLLALSVASWAIIIQKALAYRAAERQTATFLQTFRRSTKFAEVQAACPAIPESPLVGVFQAGYAEITAQLRPASGGAEASRVVLKSLTAVDRALLRASAVEVNKLEKKVTFLATIASAAPFIGLFGTVWGIMDAFREIGTTGSTNLSVIGPGISEALIATAAGLFAAIPAVFFYNHFTSKTKALASEIDDFSLEFLNISERNFT
ncbi:MAG TPA: MotA/TolQ/ExbB proton channel family protein [Vicinamibacterales bacterium]